MAFVHSWFKADLSRGFRDVCFGVGGGRKHRHECKVSGYWSTAALDGSGLVCNDSKEMIEFHQFDQFRRGDAMLAEKFILLLEALIKSAQYPDGSYRVKNTSPHVPVELPTKK